MANPGAALKRVPKWAWIASGGVVAGVAVMRLKANQTEQVDKNTEDNTPAGDYGLTQASYPLGSGVVAANTGAVGATYDTGSSGGGFDYAGFLSSLGDFTLTVRPDPVDPVGIIDALGPYLGAGGAPQSSTTQAPPVVNVYAPTAPAPAPAAPVPAPVSRTYTKDNGKRGADRRVWCMCGDHKVADGACWAEGSPCT